MLSISAQSGCSPAYILPIPSLEECQQWPARSLKGTAPAPPLFSVHTANVALLLANVSLHVLTWGDRPAEDLLNMPCALPEAAFPLTPTVPSPAWVPRRVPRKQEHAPTAPRARQRAFLRRHSQAPGLFWQSLRCSTVTWKRLKRNLKYFSLIVSLIYSYISNTRN